MSGLDREKLAQVSRNVVKKCRETIRIVDFWENAFEIKRLKGELSDILLASDCEPIMIGLDHIVTEITALAKARHRDLIK